jgi:hypothetical protein
LAAVIAAIIATLAPAQTIESALQELQQRLDYARGLLDETHVSETSAGIPSGEYWATQQTHDDLIAAINAAQAVLDNAADGHYLEVGGARVSKSVSYVCENYIDVTLSLDTNPGLWSFMTDLVFDETKLMPVSIDVHDLYGFQNLMPPLDGGRYPHRRIFLASTFGTGASHTIGLISTTRFKIADEISLPQIYIGHLNVNVYDTSVGPRKMREFYISANGETFSQHEFGTLSTMPAGRGRPGDIYNNRNMTVSNVDAIAQWFINYDPRNPYGLNLVAADANGDGRVDLQDCVHLGSWLLGFHNDMFAMNMEYRILVNADGNSSARLIQAQNAVNSVARGFREELRTNLIFQYRGTTPSLNIRPGCPFPGDNARCALPPPHPRPFPLPPICGDCHRGSDCHIRHHRSSHHFVDVSRSSNINTFRFVDFGLCYYFSENPFNPDDPNHIYVLGVGYVGDRDMLVTLGGDATLNRIVTAHEISHMLGVTHDKQCNRNQDCVMEGDGYNRWCENCIDEIIAHRNRR